MKAFHGLRFSSLFAVALFASLGVPCADLQAQIAPAAAVPSSTAGGAGAPLAAPALPEKSAKKARVPRFKGNVIMVDPAASTFQIGKRAIKTIRVTPDTKLRNANGGSAKFADIVMGEEVTGSYRLGGDGLLQAISMRVGAKASRSGVAAIPAAPSPAPKTSGSAAVH